MVIFIMKQFCIIKINAMQNVIQMLSLFAITPIHGTNQSVSSMSK